MALKDYQGRIIALLTQQELLMAELYRLFGGLYPDNRDFWNALAVEEMEHATWVEYLYKKAQAGQVTFLEKNVRTYTAESFVAYLQDNLNKVQSKALPQQAAFSLALGIEGSLLVKKLFDHFETTDKDLSILLRDLRDKMTTHRKKLELKAASSR